MPLFRAVDEHALRKPRPRRWRLRNPLHESDWRAHEGVPSLTRLCLLNLADNMKEVWTKDYADNYLNHYVFRYIMGPFNLLPGDLVEELMWLLGCRKQLSRAALHLLLVPQLKNLSLVTCPSLVIPSLCVHIAACCQGLWSLDLSGALQLPSKFLCETLQTLPALRSLSLAGTPCDSSVIRTIVCRCRFLRHLDVSRCHLLSPAALLPLGGAAFSPSSLSPSQSPSASCSAPASSPSPLPLISLLALDVGFGEQTGDPAVAAAYLLLVLPGLERVALDELTQACCLIQYREFWKADEFADKLGIPRLEEVWRERIQGEQGENWRKRRGEDSANKEDEAEEEELILLNGYESEEEELAGAEFPDFPDEAEDKPGVSSQSDLILKLRDVKGVSCDCVGSLSHLCPNITSMSVNIDVDGDISPFASSIRTWSNQLRTLSVHHPGPLADLLPALQVAGSSLTSLTLEGVKTSPQTPLLEIIRGCPKLRDLHMSAEPPGTRQEEGADDHLGEPDLPQLPNLCSLSLSFSYEHSQMKPAMSWTSLQRVLKCLLIGSPSLEKLSFVSVPCPLNGVLWSLLFGANWARRHVRASACFPPTPLERLQRIDLRRTDVLMGTVNMIMQHSKRLRFVDLSHCWNISKVEYLNRKSCDRVQVVWV
uniref:Si:ch211-214j8.12 n=1 Tax=Oryzias sinensis TaxID=183150 RepID=A0A8C8E1I0_9TELE